ncbi:hypothetical protein K435DRAFT_605097, partial [Dendrothele bispora CBS 962.96]
LSYFHKENWPKEWEDAARRIVFEHWEEYYAPLIETCNSSKKHDDFDLVSNDLGDDFSDVENFGRSSFENVLEAYLNKPTISDEDPIKFWSSRLDPPGTKVSPRGALARMGLDFCSTPATSTDVERLFSHGGLQVTKRRHNLS